MAEAVKQFFVGFLHPRTWLAALIGLVVAAIAALAILGVLTSYLATVLSALGAGSYSTVLAAISGTALGIFFAILSTATALGYGSVLPLIIVIVSAIVAGLIFGLVSKKERIASKSIVGGLNIAVIYIAIVVVGFILMISGFTGLGALYTAVVTLLQAAWLDVIVTFLVVWWVSALISMIILSLKH